MFQHRDILVKAIKFFDFLWCFSFLSIFFKSIFLIGLMLDKTHTQIMFHSSLSIAIYRLYFYCGFVVLFLSFTYIFKSRARIWYLVTLNLFLSVLFLMDLWYFRGFNTLPTLLLLQQTSNLNNLSDSIFSMFHWQDIIFVADIFILAVLIFRFKNLYKSAKRNIIVFLFLFLLSLILVTYKPVELAFSNINNNESLIFKYDSTVTSYNLSPVGYHFFSIYSFWENSRTINLRTSEKKEISDWFIEKKESLVDNKYKAIFKGKNLIFIQAESMENFVLNQSIDGQEITPNLNKILKNSIYFSNIYEQVNEGMSSDADLLANTSVYPLRQGSTFFRYPYTKFISLPNLLENYGYTTLAIHPDNGSFWNWMVALKSIGFDKCIDSKEFDCSDSFGMGISDGSYLSQAEPIIVKQKQPFYTFMVTLSNHVPYKLPQSYKELKLDENLDNSSIGRYLQSAHYADKHLGIFLDNLLKDGIFDNTVVVIYGDHEGLHKYYAPDVSEFKPSQDWWMNNHKQIPFIVYSNSLAGEEIKTIGGHIDILPTISYLMGIDEKYYINSAMGRNLLNTNKSFAVLSNGEFVGENNQTLMSHAIKGLDVADMAIRSNHFRDSAK